MSLIKKLAGETAIYGLSYTLGRVLNYLLFTWYLTRVFNEEQEQYGLFTDFYFYVAFILVLLTLRMETAFFRFGKNKVDRDRAFSIAAGSLVGTASVWGLIILLFKDKIAAALQYHDMGKHVLVLGGVLVFDILMAIPFARLRLENRPIRFAAYKILGVIFNIGMVLFLLEFFPKMSGGNGLFSGWYDPSMRLFYVFFANLLASLLVFILLIPHYFKVKWQLDPALFKKMILYSLPLIVVGIAGVINQSSYITFQKHILPNSITENLSDGGIYAAAAKIAILMNLFTVAFNYAAEPFFFQNADRKDAKEIYAHVARAFSIVGSVIFLGIMLYIDLIQLILGKSFRAGLDVVPILLIAFFFLGMYYNFSIWYKLKDKTIYGAYISFGGALITVILNIVLIRQMEVMGSAWAALACYAFMTIACYLIGRRFYPVPYNIPRIALHMIIAIGFYLFSQLLDQFFVDNLWNIIGLHTLILILYLAVIYFIEKHWIRSQLLAERQPS